VDLCGTRFQSLLGEELVSLNTALSGSEGNDNYHPQTPSSLESDEDTLLRSLEEMLNPWEEEGDASSFSELFETFIHSDRDPS